MKMLMLVCSESLQRDLLESLKKSGVACGYSIISKVTGCGETGTVSESTYFTGLGFNTMIYLVIPESDFERVVDAIKAFHQRLVQAQRGARIPLKLFVQSCEMIL